MYCVYVTIVMCVVKVCGKWQFNFFVFYFFLPPGTNGFTHEQGEKRYASLSCAKQYTHAYVYIYIYIYTHT